MRRQTACRRSRRLSSHPLSDWIFGSRIVRVERCSEHGSERTEIDIEILVAQPKYPLELRHLFVELEERLSHPLDLLVRQGAGLDSPSRLAFEQLTDELDNGEHELREALLDPFRVDGNMPRATHRRGARLPRELDEHGRITDVAIGERAALRTGARLAATFQCGSSALLSVCIGSDTALRHRSARVRSQ